MTTQLFLEDQDLSLLADLLRAERDELPTEIRRTDTPALHETLKQRLARVTGLLHKLEHEAELHSAGVAVPD